MFDEFDKIEIQALKSDIIRIYAERGMPLSDAALAQMDAKLDTVAMKANMMGREFFPDLWTPENAHLLTSEALKNRARTSRDFSTNSWAGVNTMAARAVYRHVLDWKGRSYPISEELRACANPGSKPAGKPRATVPPEPKPVEVPKPEPKPVEVPKPQPEGPRIVLPEGYVMPPALPRIIWWARNGRNVYLLGPAGTGKTETARIVAASLGCKCLVFGTFAMRSDLTGYKNVAGDYIPSPIVEALESGEKHVICFDELDGNEPEIMISINALFANNVLMTPKGEVENKNCILIATANTAGNGATEDYTGRAVQDLSTMDRFAVEEFYYLEELELANAGGNKGIVDFVHALRKAARNAGASRFLITYRGIKNLALGLECPKYAIAPGQGSAAAQALKSTILKGSVPKDTLCTMIDDLPADGDIADETFLRLKKGLREVYRTMED